MSFIWIALAIFLVLLNAFFVAAEFGMVKLRATRLEIIEEAHGVRGKILKEVHNNLDAYLSACQLGITLASLGLGWIGEPAFSALLRPAFHLFVDSEQAIELFSFLIAFSFLSFLHIVVGELMPKSLAIRQSESVSLWTAIPLYTFYWIMYPAIWLLNSCANFLLERTHLNQVHHGERYYSAEEIKFILSTSYVHGEIGKDESEILEHTLDFAELYVTDVMRPIEEMVTLNLHDNREQVLEKVIKTRYTRFPVVDDGQIVGLVHIKDLFIVLYEQKSQSSLKEIMRPILKVNERFPALELLRRFKSGASHFAVVYRGQDTPKGFVTLDNLLHMLVGKIKDEFHKTKDDWVALPDGCFLMSGTASLYSVERALNIDINVQEEVTTLYGLILNTLGSLPEIGQRIDFPDFSITIQAMKGAKILEVKVCPVPKG